MNEQLHGIKVFSCLMFVALSYGQRTNIYCTPFNPSLLWIAVLLCDELWMMITILEDGNFLIQSYWIQFAVWWLFNVFLSVSSRFWFRNCLNLPFAQHPRLCQVHGPEASAASISHQTGSWENHFSSKVPFLGDGTVARRVCVKS